MDDLAGHRIAEPHDCFALNCKDLGAEVLRLQEQIVDRDAEVARLQDLVGEDQPEDPALYAASVVEAIEATGAEVGTLTGPPIVGTNDRVNAGPAKPASGA